MSVRPLSLELAKKAELELGETPKKLADSIQYIKEWLSKQPHLDARTDDQWLASFIRGCKFSLERTKEKIDLYYSLRTTLPEITCIDPEDPKVMEIIDLGVSYILPKPLESTGPKIAIFKPGAYDSKEYDIMEIMAVENIKQKIAQLEDDYLLICGVTTILDLDGVDMGHFSQMTLTNIKKMTMTGQDAFPVRMKGLHYINTPPGFDTVFKLFTAFLNEKNKKRIYVHNKDFDALYKHVPKELLPTEYGGQAGPLKDVIENSKQRIIQFMPWLKEDMKYGTNESKRPGKPKTSEDMFGGLEGSFRTLDLD